MLLTCLYGCFWKFFAKNVKKYAGNIVDMKKWRVFAV